MKVIKGGLADDSEIQLPKCIDPDVQKRQPDAVCIYFTEDFRHGDCNKCHVTLGKNPIVSNSGLTEEQQFFVLQRTMNKIK